MAPVNLTSLETWASKDGSVNVVIETAKGCKNKFEYEPDTGGFALSKVLPRGMAFPYDFGFIPSTLAEDGDPLDVLVLMDEPAFAGCRIVCRLIGVIEGENHEDGKTQRNDRLVAVAKESRDHSDTHSLKNLNDDLVDQIEHFFIAYHDLDGKTFKPLGRHGPRRAEKLVREAAKRLHKKRAATAKASRNGAGKRH